MIKVSHLVKKFDTHTVVNDLSFSVNEGEILGFLGPNGAGKSTTMNMLTGYLAPTSGTIRINDIDIQENPIEAKKCIGYLPEVPPLYTDMTVREYLTFAAKLKGAFKAESGDALDSLLETLSLKKAEKKLIKNLSKGYKQRVGMACALLGDPKVLILDEPASGLDPIEMVNMRTFIRNLSKTHTIILSSHLLSEVSAVCDRIMIISEGSMIALNTPENLENLFCHATRTLIRVGRADKSFITSVQAVKGVSKVTLLPSQEPDTLELEIEASPSEDIRETLFNLCCENHCPLLMLQSDHLSLEDIFLKATDSKIQNSESR